MLFFKAPTVINTIRTDVLLRCKQGHPVKSETLLLKITLINLGFFLGLEELKTLYKILIQTTTKSCNCHTKMVRNKFYEIK